MDTAAVDAIDLNADVAESFGRWRLGDDDALLRVVSSANVACGFHAGDPSTIAAACATAVAHGVAIGAQVGYRDLAGFGRRFVDVDPRELGDEVTYQVGALAALASVAGGTVGHVKPHGALYHATVHHEGQARAVVEAVAAYDRRLAVVGLPGSLLLQLAEAAGLRTIREAFVDRAYRRDGSLVPRTEPGAVLSDPSALAERALRIVTCKEVEAVDGSVVALDAQSLCVHGDSAEAVATATLVRAALEASGVIVEAAR